MKKHPEKYGLQNALLIGIIFYPLFYLLDIIIYPDFKFSLLTIRAIAVACFGTLLVLTHKLNEKYLFHLILGSFFIAGFGITLMCFVSNAGFASPYYAGNFLVLVSASIFFRIALKPFIILMSSIILQHFILLLFIPFELKDILINLFFLGACAVISTIIHQAMLNLYKENRFLKNFIPICANCKKIRDDQGYWNQIEEYLSQHSDTKFSHGICPECAQELYGDIINLKKNIKS